MMIRLLLLVALLCPLRSFSATINAASGSEADVETAIASASPGDTVLVPADSESWSGGVSFSGITVQGVGWKHGSIVTAGTVTMTKHASQYTRLIGFQFTGTGLHVDIVGDSDDKMVICESNYFNTTGSAMVSQDVNGVLWAECVFRAASPTGSDVFAINLGGSGGGQGEASWTADPLMGALDTTGEGNTYFENCYWTNILETCIDNDNGARTVIRYSTFHDAGIVAHGGGSGSSGNDSSAYGNKYMEIYNNVFHRVSNSAALNRWVRWRGGSGVFMDNQLDEASSPDGSTYPNKPAIQLGVCCPGAYPLSYQVGQAELPADATPDFPIIFSGNTGDGVTEGTFISVGENPNCSCGTPGNYIQSGRDYATSNTWGYNKYTYPHPRRSGADVTAPTVSTVTISSDGTTWTFACSETVTIGAGGNGGFATSMSGGAVTLTYSSGSGSSSLVYTGNRTVMLGESGTLAYTQPGSGVEDSSDNDLANFSGKTVVNNSSQTGDIPAVTGSRLLPLKFSR